ncbi:MAG: prolipoprotein diacylglyceryl transferase [Nevskiaceae bacterium]|jgi:phosphatidylglycerol:prolipoprotein diacylglycerol transferase|nr:prolipoprotein diacylglyceryl transferase [Nevskiaceae bacterium]
MIRYPNIDPIAVSLGPLNVHWYGIMYIIGFGAAWWLGRRVAARPGSTWKTDDVDDLLFWAMVGVILGGRIGYVLIYGRDLMQEDLLYPLKIWKGGMSFHGALAGVIIALLAFARSRRRNWLDVLDFAAPLPGIGILAGRLGNFINNELWGAPTTVPWAFGVPDRVTGEVIARHPSQLYEACFEGLLMFLLVWWFARKPRARGMVFGLALTWYAIVRGLAETVRLPDEQIGYLAGDWLTMGMVLSIPMYVVGTTLLASGWTRPKRSGNWAAA